MFCVIRRQKESEPPHQVLLDGDRLGQVTREINVKTLKDGQPVSNELQRDNVEETLEAVNRLGDLNLHGL